MRRFEILLIAICLVATYGLYDYTLRTNNDAADTEFRKLADSNVRSMQERMDQYVQALNGTAAFLEASDNVTRDEFSLYVQRLNIPQFLPGILGIGFIEPVPEGQERAFLSRMRRRGEVGFNIHPETDSAEKYVISRLAPHAANRGALGLDITFEEGRRSAADAARQANEPRLTPRILLVQDKTQTPGFLLLRPLYAAYDINQAGTPLSGGFKGWVYAPFVGANLMQNLSGDAGDRYAFSVFDGSEPRPEMLIYSSGTDQTAPGKHDAVYTVPMFGRTWTVAFHSTAIFDQTFNSWLPLAILIVSGMLTAMLVFSVHNLRDRGEALEELANLRGREVDAGQRENRALIENAVTPVLILDSEQKVIFGNQAAIDCFGYNADELQGMPFTALVHAVADQPSPEGDNAKGQTRSGAPLILDVQRNAWKTVGGEQRFTAVVRNMSAEYHSRQELQKTKTLYDMALQGSQIGVFDLNLVTGKSDVSDTWLEVMGLADLPPELDPQKVFLDRLHPDDRADLHLADGKCISGEAPRSVVEYRIKFPDGKWRWMRSDSVVVERDEAGRALRMIGTQSDVTEIRRSRNALEASEQRFRQVLSAAPIGMALMDERGRFSEVNDALCKLSGCSLEELLENGQLSDFMSFEERKKLYAGINHIMNSGAEALYQAEHQMIDKQGRHRWGLFNVSWAFDKNANQHFYIAQINDITDKKKLEQAKNQFVSTVSHELRTPLTSIKGALGLIEAAEGKAMGETSRRLVDIARSNTDKLTTIVNDILDLEKISSGDVSFDFQTVDICALARDVILEMSPFAVTHNNTLRVEAPDTAICANADHGRTKQVLTNLVSNACKYSNDETEVMVKVEEVGDQVVVFVQNAGPGIPESFKPQMFQAFSQADSSDTRAKGGTGLGLNITRQIVNRHGGEIGFQSVPDRVTVFWFSYPLSQDNPSRGAPVEAPGIVLFEGERAKVLHVEDDREFAEVLRSGLGDVADVTLSTTISDAVVRLSRSNFDVVILDWVLPDGEADDLVELIDSEFPSIKIISLSANADLQRDPRISAHLVKSRTDLTTIADHVTGQIRRAS